MKVLVREKIGESGVQLLRDAGLDVELGLDWDQDELERRIGEFDGILIRSATQLDADLLSRAERLKAVGRAGVGVDNVDVEAATKRGVIVANAPQSNVITAAEHTLALLLALARKVPKLMRDRFGVTIAGGQGKLKGRIARIAHCGYFGAFDIIVTISALEMTLRELGHEAEPGAGVAAAQRVFSDAGVALHA